MRITDAGLYERFLAAFGKNRETIDRAIQQLADNKRVRVASDDPAAARVGLQLRARLVRIEGYTTSGRSALSDLRHVEETLSAMRERLEKAQERGLAGSTFQEANESIAIEIDGIREDLIRLANTSHNGRYLLGGTETQTLPFLDDGTYQGNADEVQASIDKAVTIGITVSGGDALQGAGDALTTLENLAAALRADDHDGIQAAVIDLTAHMNQVTQVRTRVGYNEQRIERTLDALDLEQSRLIIRLVEEEGISLERVATELAQANNSTEALGATAANVLGRSLFDFLG